MSTTKYSNDHLADYEWIHSINSWLSLTWYRRLEHPFKYWFEIWWSERRVVFYSSRATKEMTLICRQLILSIYGPCLSSSTSCYWWASESDGCVFLWVLLELWRWPHQTTDGKLTRVLATINDGNYEAMNMKHQAVLICLCSFVKSAHCSFHYQGLLHNLLVSWVCAAQRWLISGCFYFHWTWVYHSQRPFGRFFFQVISRNFIGLLV